MASMPAATIYPQSHVGFDSITSQIERKLLKRGFQFNIICVGEFLVAAPSRAPGVIQTDTTACPRVQESFALRGRL